MKVIKQSVTLLNPEQVKGMNKIIEAAGRTCYKSEDKITNDSADMFVAGIIKRGHEAMLEHGGIIQFRVITDIGVTHELVRHRIGVSYAQESTRYCDYNKTKFGSELTFILPTYLYLTYDEGFDKLKKTTWYQQCDMTEMAYNAMDSDGYTAQEKAAILPKSLKTEIVVTFNPRSFREFLKLRLEHCAKPQMQDIARQMACLVSGQNPLLIRDVMKLREKDIMCNIYQRDADIAKCWNELNGK